MGAHLLQELARTISDLASWLAAVVDGAWPLRRSSSSNSAVQRDALLELVTADILLPPAGHIEGLVRASPPASPGWLRLCALTPAAAQVSLLWLEIGWAARDATQTYAATQSAADSQRRLQAWLAVAPCSWAPRLALLVMQVWLHGEWLLWGVLALRAVLVRQHHGKASLRAPCNLACTS